MGTPKKGFDYTYVKYDGGHHEADEGNPTQPWAMTLTGVDEANRTTMTTLSTSTKSREEAYAIKHTIKCMRRQGYKYVRAKFDKERKVENDMVTHNIEMD
eukprot:16434269-Heterocapsa_arctica.AAC.1